MNNFCREICINISTSFQALYQYCLQLLAQCLENDNELFGGPEVIVEADEAKIGRRKYNRGRIIRGQWIFGAIERNNPHTFVVPIKDRSTTTLTAIIQKHIVLGTITHRIREKNSSLNEFNYIHRIVNHS